MKRFRSLLRRQLLPLRTLGSPLGDTKPLPYGFVTWGQEEAFAEACRRFVVAPLNKPARSRLGKSCGAPVAAGDGSQSWIKVSGIPAANNGMREREQAAAMLKGIPKPDILRILDWVSDDVHWRALQMTLAPSTVAATDHFGRGLRPIADSFIRELKAALRALGQIKAQHWHRTPELIAGWITRRFGQRAPHVADEWYTAHGDLNWANITAPNLSLLDWETWGLAPCGYDIAYLIVHTGYDLEMVRRLELAFADELSTLSGRVALLTACAEMLHYVEEELRDPLYWRVVNDLAQGALQR